MRKQQFRIDLSGGLDTKHSDYTVIPNRLVQADNVIYSDLDTVAVRAGFSQITDPANSALTGRMWSNNGQLTASSSDDTDFGWESNFRYTSDLSATNVVSGITGVHPSGYDYRAQPSWLPEFWSAGLPGQNSLAITQRSVQVAVDETFGYVCVVAPITNSTAGKYSLAFSILDFEGHVTSSGMLGVDLSEIYGLRVVSVTGSQFIVYYGTLNGGSKDLYNVVISNMNGIATVAIPAAVIVGLQTWAWDVIAPHMNTADALVLGYHQAALNVRFLALSATDGVTVVQTTNQAVTANPLRFTMGAAFDGTYFQVYAAYQLTGGAVVKGLISGHRGTGTTLSSYAGLGETTIKDFTADFFAIYSLSIGGALRGTSRLDLVAGGIDGTLNSQKTMLIDSISLSALTGGTTRKTEFGVTVTSGIAHSNWESAPTPMYGVHQISELTNNPTSTGYLLHHSAPTHDTGIAAVFNPGEAGSLLSLVSASGTEYSHLPRIHASTRVATTANLPTVLLAQSRYAADTFASKYGVGNTPNVWDIVKLTPQKYGGSLGSTEADGGTFLPAAAPRFDDHSAISEFSFPQAPDIRSVTATAGVLMTGGDYLFKAVYSWQDAQGNRWYSPESAAKAFSHGGNTNADVVVALDSIHNHFDGVVQIYRTTNGGASYYFDNEARVTGASVTIAVAASDANLSGYEQIYTSGDVITNSPLPALRQACVWQRRIFGTDGRRIYFTHQKDLGTGYEYSPVNTLNPPGDWGRIVGVAPMDDKLVIFCEHKVGYIYGQGPNRLGEGQFSDPVPAVQSTGARWGSHVGIAPTDEGIWFHAKNGLRLLTRGLQIARTQDGLELGTLADGYTPRANIRPYTSQVYNLCIGVQQMPGIPELRFFFDDGTCLTYNREQTQFTRFTGAAAATSVCVTDKAFHAKTDAVGGTSTIYYYDEGVSGGSKQPIGDGTARDEFPIILKTGRISLAGIQGYVRLSSVGVHLETPDAFTSLNPVRITISITTDDSTTSSETFDLWAQGQQSHIFDMQAPVQKCTTAQIQVQIDPNGNGTTVVGAELGRIRVTNLTLTLGIKEGTSKQQGVRK